MTRVKATLDVKTTTSFIEDPTEPDEIPTIKHKAKHPKKQIKTSSAKTLAFAACFLSILLT